mmetsp:Transcript_17009/g.27338  ORF Transcript_17009/g.27338 Transcript_17009/m.27338 type:complete len:200 (+) Transcript_17009:63-662(+)
MSTCDHSKDNIRKRIASMHNQVKDADVQLEFVQILYDFCRDEPSTGVVVQGGGVKLILAVMQNHLEDTLLQRECLVLLQRLIGRGGTSATKIALGANIVDKLCNAMDHHKQDKPLQGAAASVFRELLAKGGEHAARQAADSDAAKLLSSIKSKDVNVQYQAVHAVRAIQRLAPQGAQKETEDDDDAPVTPSEEADVIVY